MALRFAPARGATSFSMSSAVRGPAGAAATATAGSTTTANAGTSATVVNSGSTSAATFDFTIPRGADSGARYSFESSTTMAAPSSGGIRANNATLSSATAFAVNASDLGGVDVSDWIATWDDSTNTAKGTFALRKEGSGSVAYIFTVTSVTDNTSWLQINGAYVSGSGTLTASDRVYLIPFLTGNIGSVSGPGVSVDSEIALFSGTGGGTLKRATGSGVATVTSGVLGVSGTGTTATFGTIELGAASDTTLSRSSAGVLAVEGVTVALNSTSSTHTAGTIELGNASDTTLSRASAGVIAVEGVNLTPNIPISSKSAAYTTALADANTAIYHPSSDNNARTFTIDSNANVAYPVGTTLTFINDINTVTIAITTDTLVFAGPNSTGSRTLAAGGMATAIKVASTRWYISGAGLS